MKPQPMDPHLQLAVTTTVDNLQFRVAKGRMRPNEVFFAHARRCFAEGEFERALALVNAYRTLAGADPAAIRLMADIEAKGISVQDIPSEVARGVQEEYDIFNAIPAEIRTLPLRPENYIAIHPFAAKTAKLERWKLEDPGPIRTQVVKQGSALWAACEQVEYDVFTAPDVGYLPENESRRIPDFDHFGRQEFIAVSRSGRIVGVMRLVYAEGSRMGAGMFQTYDRRRELNIFPDQDCYLRTLCPRDVVDLTSMAIDRGERDSRASKALISGTIRRIWETGRRHALACIDTPFCRKLQGRALAFQELGPSTYYWGSPTTACILDTYSVPRGAMRVLIPYFKARGLMERVRLDQGTEQGSRSDMG